MMKLLEKLKEKDRKKDKDDKNGAKAGTTRPTTPTNKAPQHNDDDVRRAMSYRDVRHIQVKKVDDREEVRRVYSVGTFTQDGSAMRSSHSLGVLAQRFGLLGRPEHNKSWQVLELLANEPGFKYDITQFEVIKQIGSGAFGRVLLAKHLLTGQKVVLKAIEKRHIRKDKQRQHLLDERKALKTLAEHKCPFVVHAIGCFQDANCLYFVMEYVAGGELFAHLRAAQGHRFSEKRAQFYICEVILALQHMHETEHIVYRDIKPENMLLDEDGHVKLIDFGFAKQLEGDERTYTFCGTPDYLAPEVVRNNGYGIEADYWALGVLVYELLVGHAPFMTVDPRTGRNRYDDILSARLSFPKDLSTEAQALIAALLNINPQARLGARTGMDEIKRHPFFKGVDWEAVMNRQLKPPKLHKVKKGTVNIQGNIPLSRTHNPGPASRADKELFKDFDFTIKANKDSETIAEESDGAVEAAATKDETKRGFHIGRSSSEDDTEEEEDVLG